MVENVVEVVEVAEVVRIAPVMRDRGDLFPALRATQMTRDPDRQNRVAAILGPDVADGPELQFEKRPGGARKIERFRHEEGVKGHRQARRRGDEHTETFADVLGVAPERAVLELQIDGVVARQGAADFLDVAVA